MRIIILLRVIWTQSHSVTQISLTLRTVSLIDIFDFKFDFVLRHGQLSLSNCMKDITNVHNIAKFLKIHKIQRSCILAVIYVIRTLDKMCFLAGIVH